ncbi:MAG: hypothetical protein ACJAQW_000667 [Paracoccaceae bacterium]|jgi:hypothetical protein
MTGTYGESFYLGLTTSHLVRLPDGTEIVSREISGMIHNAPAPGAQVRLHWQADALRLHTS